MIEFSVSGKCMTVFLSGEIDHHTASGIRKRIDEETDRLLPQLLVLDFGGVSFMDSSGVGLVMGRYRNVSAHGGRLEAVNLSPWCYKIMKMSGLDKIAKILMEEFKLKIYDGIENHMREIVQFVTGSVIPAATQVLQFIQQHSTAFGVLAGVIGIITTAMLIHSAAQAVQTANNGETVLKATGWMQLRSHLLVL